MNVLLVSQCHKNALKETRRILDQFAERRGERTWQTPITTAGLDTLRKMLRKTARKNTAVACHWIRGLNHSELLWIVGNGAQFNMHGATPIATTARNILRARDENDWHTAEIIQWLATTAALLHDLGKAVQAFQRRLDGSLKERNRFRHEWTSLCLFAAFVGGDDDAAWLERLSRPNAFDESSWLRWPFYPPQDGQSAHPLRNLPPVAKAIGWLILTHHRMPVAPVSTEKGQRPLGTRTTRFKQDWLDAPLGLVTHAWNEIDSGGDPNDIEPYWTLAGPLPVTELAWRRRMSRAAARLYELHCGATHRWLDNPYVMHLARLSLMLADHQYSSLGLDENDQPVSARQPFLDKQARLSANTVRDRRNRIRPNQSLNEHLLGVAHYAGRIAHALPLIERDLPRLANHRGLRRRSKDKNFRWQDRAYDEAVGIREKRGNDGVFVVNMASTGCGKTLANARVLYALADPAQGMRATFALGLRTLTLQTGRSYRKDLSLNDDKLAVRVGGTATRALFEYYEDQATSEGSESTQALIDEDTHVLFEGMSQQSPLVSTFTHDPRIKSLVSAPLLVCTVDHLMPATEALRGGRHIPAMLRMMSADLVLDELDDYDLADMPALTRLVYWAGLLGTRIVLSSATLAPSLIEGMFLSYRAGRAVYQRNRGAAGGSDIERVDVSCLWVDEFEAHNRSCADRDAFVAQHSDFITKRANALRKKRPPREAALVRLDISRNCSEDKARSDLADHVREACTRLHRDHATRDPHTGKRASFGLVRMANIDPLFDVACHLHARGAPEDTRFHLCVYHARFPLLQRSATENELDGVFDRRQENSVFERPVVRHALDAYPEPNHLFIVLASPVCEVGRDWDADWAIAEPSSMRSLIQLAGRIQRHRRTAPAAPNLLILDTNLRYCSNERTIDGHPPAIFVRPGFEKSSEPARHTFRLIHHRLGKLMTEEEYRWIDALPRIAPSPVERWQSKQRLVDLEHARLLDVMLPRAGTDGDSLNAATVWQYPMSMLTGILPQQQPFRFDPIPKTRLAFLPDEDDALRLHRVDEERALGRRTTLYRPIEDSQRENVDLNHGPRINTWATFDLSELLLEQSRHTDLSMDECAKKFAQVDVPQQTQGWRFHPALGFSKRR